MYAIPVKLISFACQHDLLIGQVVKPPEGGVLKTRRSAHGPPKVPSFGISLLDVLAQFHHFFPHTYSRLAARTQRLSIAH